MATLSYVLNAYDVVEWQ